MEVKDLSLRLYHYLCKYIIGTEHHVKTIRLLNTVGDNLSRKDGEVVITSGSFGEGLQIRGSDLDLMFVLQDFEVQDNISPIAFNANKTNFAMMTEDTKPGFAMLRLITNFHHEFIPKCCKQFRRHIYLSNVLFKNYFLNDFCSVVHGPCVSDKAGFHDIACCLHSKYWVISALQWTMRSSNVWPSENTKQMIINHGVLFVPIGNKESENEEFEWRMSFSVGEKFLMYTFNHTQLLCYALMKILLKDVINTDSRCKKLLCSYNLKTIMFWISEEIQPSVWTPDNLIPCFMRCFRRLIYCVQYQVCPHYFIPENNLFENKIDRLDRDNLMETLRVLFSYGWRCILLSKNISHVSILSCNIKFFYSCLYFDDFNKLLLSKIFLRVSSVSSTRNNYNRAIYYSLNFKSKKLKYIHAYFISAVCSKHCQSLYLSKTISNKNQYREYNTCLSYLLMSINHDIVSGWMMLASFFYKANQYQKSLMISSYALSKCTLEKIFRGTELSVIQRFAIKRDEIRKQGVVHSLKFILVDFVLFATSTLIPMELLIEGKSFELPPVFCAHFLSFLSHYHMYNVKECQRSLLDLQLTIAENYFMGKDTCATAFSYYCLGTALQIIGDNKAAKQAFTKTVKLLHPYPQVIQRLKRLYLTAPL